MENAAEAMKMAGAALLFVLAFSITMIMFGQCKNTADIVMEHLQINDFMHGVNGNDDNVTRVVGLETVIPTIYRYNNQDTDLRVIIMDSSEKVRQVFDQTLESDIAAETGKVSNPEYYQHLQALYNKAGDLRGPYMYGAPWANDRQKSLERINCFITGSKANILRNSALGTNSGTSTGYKDNNNFLYSDSIIGASDNPKFSETYTEYRTSGTILIDDYGEEIITKQPNGTKKIIIYKRIL